MENYAATAAKAEESVIDGLNQHLKVVNDRWVSTGLGTLDKFNEITQNITETPTYRKIAAENNTEEAEKRLELCAKAITLSMCDNRYTNEKKNALRKVALRSVWRQLKDIAAETSDKMVTYDAAKGVRQGQIPLSLACLLEEMQAIHMHELTSRYKNHEIQRPANPQHQPRP